MWVPGGSKTHKVSITTGMEWQFNTGLIV